jgi:heme/copper-type cytochrome/quinol oxidase subunit 3
LHALHVAVGVALLAWLWVRELRHAAPHGLSSCAAYWHFMGVLWAVLFVVLYFVR